MRIEEMLLLKAEPEVAMEERRKSDSASANGTLLAVPRRSTKTTQAERKQEVTRRGVWRKLASKARRMSPGAAFLPLQVTALVCGMYSLSCRPHSSRGVSALLVGLNLLSVLLCVGTYLTVIGCDLHATPGMMKMSSGNIASLYLTTFDVGQLFLVLAFVLVGSRAFRGFLKAYEDYRSQHRRSGERRYPYVVLLFFVLYLVFEASVLSLQEGGMKFTRQELEVDNGSATDLCMLPELTESRAFQGVRHFYRSQIMAISFTFYFSIWFYLYLEARRFQIDFRHVTTTTLDLSPGVLESFRLRHGKLCDLIGQANGLVTHILGAFYGSGIPCILFILHGFVYRALTSQQFQSLMLLFLAMVLDVSTVTLSGALLNLKMHEPLNILYKLPIETLPFRGSEIVAAFTARLQGPSIGFHLYRLLTVDTSTIIMIGGSVLTYALVIIQFQPPVGKASGEYPLPSAHTTPDVTLAGPQTVPLSLGQGFNATT